MRVLITSGGCKVPIDDVRHIGNFSSGRYGVELANEFRNSGAETLLFREKGSLRWRHDDTEYKDYDDYRINVKNIIKLWQPDIIVSAAAISDYIVDKTEGKISSDSDELVIRLKKGEKVISSFREIAPNAIVVGFKLLVNPTHEEKWKAVEKVRNAGAHVVIYNDLAELRQGKSSRYIMSPRGYQYEAPNPATVIEYVLNFREGYLKPE